METAVTPKDVSDDGIARYICPKCEGLTTGKYHPAHCEECGTAFTY